MSLASTLFSRPLIAIALSCLAGLPLFGADKPQAGVATEWDVRKDVATLAAQIKRLKPILDQIKPDDWVSKGAPAAYTGQWKATRATVDALEISTGNMAYEPEKLTTALDTLFRMQNLELQLISLAAGVRKYQNPALADLLQGVMSESSGSREKLRQYVLDLAAMKEAEFKVMDEEAQRCRGMISRQPNHANRAETRKEGTK